MALIDETRADLAAHAVPAAGAERAADELMRHLDGGSPGWQEATTRLQSGIKIVRSGLDALTVKTGQPSVAQAGGPRLPGLSPERTTQLGLLLNVAEAMLTTAQAEGVLQRAPRREAHRVRLLEQADAVARGMFASETSPGGWRSMFATLQSASDDAVVELSHARDEASRQIRVDELALTEIRDLLAGRPSPPMT
jgi:hypothetical protein